MKRGIFFMAAAAASLTLAGCASSGSRPAPAARADASPPPVAAPRGTDQRRDLVVGRNAASIIALFGQPALDVQEGIARKLQFSGPGCVLDAYLYPPRERGEAVVTHVDARSPDGRDADRAACIAALRRR
jgi:hypothetical protein